MADSIRSKYRGPDIVLRKRQAVGHGECQNPDCEHRVTWYDMLPGEDYANCVICGGFMIVTRVVKREDDDE